MRLNQGFDWTGCRRCIKDFFLIGVVLVAFCLLVMAPLLSKEQGVMAQTEALTNDDWNVYFYAVPGAISTSLAVAVENIDTNDCPEDIWFDIDRVGISGVFFVQGFPDPNHQDRYVAEVPHFFTDLSTAGIHFGKLAVVCTASPHDSWIKRSRLVIFARHYIGPGETYSLSSPDNAVFFERISNNTSQGQYVIVMPANVPAPPPPGVNFIGEAYLIQSSASSGQKVDLTIRYDGQSIGSINPLALQIYQFINEVWLPLGNIQLHFTGGANKIYLSQGGRLGTIAAWSSKKSDDTQSVAWGDMDGDGDLDLAVGNSGVNQMYENDGQGGFTPSDLGADTYDTQSVAWGDMDGDGDLDLAVGNSGVNQVYENDMQSGFTPSDLGADTYDTQSVAWGDMDGDGDLDLAVGNSGLNQVYENDGQSGFTPSDLGADTYDTQSVAWGDMDGDGDLDLAVGNSGLNQVYENDGQSGFTPSDLGADTYDTQSVAWGDMDGDGDLDLAVGNSGVNQVYENDGQGGFIPSDLGADTYDTQSVAWGDMDGDGDLELAVGHRGAPDRVHENPEGGNLQFDPANGLGWQASRMCDTQSVAWGDLDGDGDLDLATGNLGGAYVQSRADQLTAYVLGASPRWVDDFNDQRGLDLVTMHNVRQETADNGKLILNGLPGLAMSLPFTPSMPISGWRTVSYDAVTPPGTSVKVSVYSGNGIELLLSDVRPGDSLAQIDPQTYPSLRLRLDMATTSGSSPILYAWSLEAAVRQDPVFLPVIFAVEEN